MISFIYSFCVLSKKCIVVGILTFNRGDDDGPWRGRLWGTDVDVQNFTCLSIQGQALTLLPLITQDTNVRYGNAVV